MLKHSLQTTPEGLTIITIPMPAVQSVTVLALCNTGSRYEEAPQQGIAHFFEHMVFKGTTKYPTAQDLAVAVDAIGANFNAFTSKEYTGYYVQAASSHLDLAMDVVSDMLLAPALRQEDIDREKGVIIEELNMYVDMPQRHIANLFDQLLFAGSGLEHDIIGTKETISSLNTADFEAFLKRWYGLQNMVVVVAGDSTVVGTDTMVQQLLTAFSKQTHHARQTKKHNPKHDLKVKPLGKGKLHLEHRATEQAHFIMGWPSLPRGDKRRFVQSILANVLGGNMSSRLFTEVREKRGLCYYVHADLDQYHDIGVFGASAGVDPKRIDEAITVTLAEFMAVADGSKPVTAAELQRAKDYVAGKLILGLEDSESVAHYYGMKEILLGEIMTPEEVLAEYNKVTIEEVMALAKETIVKDELRFALIGPFEDAERFQKLVQ